MSRFAQKIPFNSRSGGCAGFTLLEMLVVLMLVSLAATLLLQGFGYVLEMRTRFTGHLREVQGERLQQHWFLSVGSGLSASHPQESGVFQGRAEGFQGLSMASLSGSIGEPTSISWSLEQDGNLTRLVYRDVAVTSGWTIAEWPDSEATFRYLDRKGNWQRRWPPAQGVPVPQLPEAVKLMWFGDDELPWLAVPGGRSNPRSDLRDLL